MDAIERLKLSLATSPADPGLYYELGGQYLAKRRFDEAVTAYQDALRLASNHPQILLQLGNTYAEAANHGQAVLFFKRCIKADASNAAAYFNLGNSLRALGQSDEAAQHYRQALALQPNDADAHNNLGNALRDVGKLDQAITCYQRALQCNPKLYHALAHLIHQKQHVCDWNAINNEIKALKEIVNNKPEAKIPPFAFLAMPSTTAQEQLACANHWAQQRIAPHLNAPLLNSPNGPIFHHADVSPKQRLKVGYLSADFRLHPLAFLVTDVLKLHDRAHVDVFAYAYGLDDQSDARAQIVAAVDHFLDINPLNDTEAAQRIHQDGIDILVDLTGYTKHSRTAIVALKPAPISVNWLGYPGSMGSLQGQPVFDYVVVDDTVAPDPSAFSETCLYLSCYQPNNATRPVGKASSKASHHLPEDALVFCCFNQSFKITAEVFAQWMLLLQRLPNSVLWLLEANPWAVQNLRQQANAAGVDPSRLVFAPRTNIEDHLARHQHADLCLDTLPYNAHTTASDALWMGLPIVTCMGDTFPSRVCASLLNNMGLSELVTTSLEDYTALAYALATQPEKRLALRQYLTANRAQFFDPQAFVSRLETSYQRIHQAYVANGTKPLSTQKP